MSVIEWKITGDKKVVEIHRLVVYRFRVVEDVIFSSEQQLYKWRQSEIGAWVTENAIGQLEILKQPDAMYLGFEFAVVAKLAAEDVVFYHLKWGESK